MKRRSMLATDFDEGELESASEPTPEKPRPNRVYFYPLPNYLNDRRSDPRVRDNDNAVMFPFADGYREKFQLSALPGHYFEELRNGKTILGGEVIELAPEVHSAAPVQQQPPAAPLVQPQTPTNDLATVLRDALAEQRAQFEATLAQQRAEWEQSRPLQADASPYEMARQINRDQMEMRRSVYEEVRNMMPQQNPAPREPELSDKERLGLAIFKEAKVLPTLFREIREVMGTAERVDEPPSLVDKFADAIQAFAPYIGPYIGPTIGARIAAALNSQPQAQPQATQQAAPTEQTLPPYIDLPMQHAPTAAPAGEQSGDEETFNDALVDFLNGALGDIQKGAPVTEAVDDLLAILEDFAEKNPQEVEGIRQMMQQPAEAVIQLLSGAYPQAAPTLNTPAALLWFKQLKVEIAARQPVNIAERAKTA